MRRVILVGTVLLATFLTAAWPALARRGAAPGRTAAPDDRQLRVDFNGDAFSDLAVGVAFEGVGDRVGAGLVNLLEGSAGGLLGSNTVLFQGVDLGGGARVGGVAEHGDAFGAAVE